VVSFTPQPLSPGVKSPRCPLDRKLGGPQLVWTLWSREKSPISNVVGVHSRISEITRTEGQLGSQNERPRHYRYVTLTAAAIQIATHLRIGKNWECLLGGNFLETLRRITDNSFRKVGSSAKIRIRTLEHKSVLHTECPRDACKQNIGYKR
jgi:hypothetical protein